MQNTYSSVTETVTETVKEDIFGKDVLASGAEVVATIIIDFKYAGC